MSRHRGRPGRRSSGRRPTDAIALAGLVPREAGAVAVARAASLASRALGKGKGEIIGGRLALRVAPTLLGSLAATRTTVLVTGTNGKSTTTALVDAALSARGAVACNRTGANMPETGSVITVVATDAPLLPHQLNRLAHRAGLGISKFGARGDNYSGDLVVAFSTAARGLPDMGPGMRTDTELSVRMVALAFMDRLFSGVIEATTEAILNAMLSAETMTGRDDITLHALDGDRLAEILQRYDRRVFSVS